MKNNIFIAGHNGMVGSALYSKLAQDPNNNLITLSKKDLNLLEQKSVENFFVRNKIDEVYLAAARVGGIYANKTFPAEFIYQNNLIQSNVIHSAYESKVPKLLFLGSSCIYPKLCNQPIKEEYLLSGKLEETNDAYALAKINGIKMCESYSKQYGVDYRSVMPTNLYGQLDNFHPEHSHVIPALIQRFHVSKIQEKKYVSIWGSGNAKREFLHVDDMANACIKVMNMSKTDFYSILGTDVSHINIGSGKEISIKELALLIRKVVGFKGEIDFDISKPDGTPRKVLDIKKMKSSGWSPMISLKDGLQQTYAWYLKNFENIRQN